MQPVAIPLPLPIPARRRSPALEGVPPSSAQHSPPGGGRPLALLAPPAARGKREQTGRTGLLS
ncbi:hypothetical protein HMPREF0262_03158 [Clostridium sp. ATCC 29733]|nr:hypothetical protein HMPREF0262_03158 [Clostridium sp. ATCC 29733]